MKLVEASRAKETAQTLFTDPVLQWAANAVIEKTPGVEIVKCKDCKWVYRDKYSGVYFCHERQVRSEHYCSYGERKNNG